METLDHFEEQPTKKEGIFVMPKVPASITLQGRNIPFPPSPPGPHTTTTTTCRPALAAHAHVFCPS